MLGARGAAGRRARGARSAGPWAHPARQGRSPRRPCPLASRLPSGSRGSPQPSKSSSSVSSRLQLASSRLWSSAASIAPRSRAPRGSASARPAWLPGAGFETERPRERRVLALLAQPDLPDSLRTLRRIARSCQVGTLAERCCKAHGATRYVAANGGTRGRGQAAPLALAQDPAPGPPALPWVRLLRPRQGPGEGGGNGECGPGGRNDPSEDRGPGVAWRSRARAPAHPRSQNRVARRLTFSSLSEDTGGGDRGSGESTCRCAL